MWWSDPDVIPLSCGNCGMGLSGLSHDIIFFCPDCGSAWSIESGSTVRFGFEVLSSPVPPDLHLPFWIVGADVVRAELLLRPDEKAGPLEHPRDFDPGAERDLWRVILPPGEARFALPAFACEKAASFGWSVTRILDSMQACDTTVRALPGGVMSSREAGELATAVLLAGRVAEHDLPAFADIRLENRHATLAAVGFSLKAHGLQLAGTRLVLPYTAMADSRALMDFLDLDVPAN